MGPLSLTWKAVEQVTRTSGLCGQEQWTGKAGPTAGHGAFHCPCFTGSRLSWFFCQNLSSLRIFTAESTLSYRNEIHHKAPLAVYEWHQYKRPGQLHRGNHPQTCSNLLDASPSVFIVWSECHVRTWISKGDRVKVWYRERLPHPEDLLHIWWLNIYGSSAFASVS